MNKITTKENAAKVLTFVSAGLCSGLGEPRIGETCIIGAKRLAMGLSHGNTIDGLPVGTAVRSFEISLNDSQWSSPQARAKGMARISVAEWGSDAIDQRAFSELLALKTIQQLCPKLFRELAKLTKTDDGKAAMEQAAVDCESATNLNDATEKLARARAIDLALDESLSLVAEIAVECLIELKTEGSLWLDELCPKA